VNSYVLGIDVGTTGAKAVVCGANGNVEGSAYREYSCIYPQPNWVEQDAGMLARVVVEVSADAVSSSGVAKNKILSLAVSAQRDCVLFMSADGKPLKMISWMDNRAGSEVAQIDKAVGSDDFYAYSGLPLATAWILPKILWVRNNDPALWENTERIVQLHDFILHTLGADDYYEDESDAAFWGFWDTDGMDWRRDMLSLFGIDEKKLPRVLPPGQKVGAISHRIAEATGLSTSTLLCVGAGDQNCAAIGAGVVRSGTASVSIGTGGLATVFTQAPFRDPAGKGMVTNSAVHGNWQIEGLQNGAAGVFRWFRDELALYDKMEAEKSGQDPYQRLDDMIEQSPPGARGLLFLPYLGSAASPRYDQDARGSLIGLTFSHDRGDIARSVIEGITLEQKDILTAIRGAGVGIERIRIMGGATKSGLWNRLQAACYGLPVETLLMTDAAVMGAVLCACIGAGAYEDIPAASDALVRVDKVYEPAPHEISFYDELYRLYCDAYEALSDGHIFAGISRRQKI
jgi:xylulokinase